MSWTPLAVLLALLCWIGTLLFLVPMFVSPLVTIPVAWVVFRERDKHRTA
jgi:hypothetical protein